MIGRRVAIGDEVRRLHREALVFDLHNDLLTKISHVRYDLSRQHAAAAYWNPFRLDLDIPKMRAAGIAALGCLMFAGFRVGAARRFWRQLDAARALTERHPDDLTLARDAAGIRAARAAGRIALLLGVEGSYVVERDLDRDVPRLAAAGVRFLGPLWERDSLSGTSCRSREDRGLTELGRALVAACERHRIALDVSHASRRTFWDLARASTAPILASHSGAAGAHPHPRNLDDDQLREIARRGGVVGVVFVAPYVGGPFAALARVADHVEHIARVAGHDTVALGSDFDGFMPLPRGMRDARDLPCLTQILWDRGWREPELRKLIGENALRLFA